MAHCLAKKWFLAFRRLRSWRNFAMPPSMTNSHRQLLEWIAAQPRTYAEVMDAWRSTCPKLTIWEDVLDGGYVQIERNGSMRSANVTLTTAGQLILHQMKV